MIIKFDGTEYENITFDSATIKALEYDGSGMGAKSFSIKIDWPVSTLPEDLSDGGSLGVTATATYSCLSSYVPSQETGVLKTQNSNSGYYNFFIIGHYGDVWNVKYALDSDYYECNNNDIIAQLVDGLSVNFALGGITPLPLLAPVIVAGYRSTGELTFTVKNPNPYTVDYNMDAIVKTSTSSELVFTVSQETIEGNGQKSYSATRSGYDELYIEAVFSNPVTEAGQTTTLSYAKEEETEETAETTTTAEETEV